MLQEAGPRAAAIWAVACACCLCTPAHAQQTPQQPRPVIPTPADIERLLPQPPVEEAEVPAQPAARPPRQLARPEAEVKIDIAAFSVGPQAPERLKQALPSLTGRFAGPGKTFADMSDAAAEVTRYLQAELGFYLGYAYIPEQEPVNGVIRIEVLEGRLDRLQLVWREGLPVERSRVEAVLARLQPGQPLMVQDLERAVFLVNDLRGITAEFEIAAGQVPGTAVLIVRPREQPLTTWRVDLDNYNARTLGRERLSGNFSLYSPFGRGDTLSGSLVVASGLAFGLGSYITPVGSDGLRLGVSASVMQYQVDKDEFPTDIHGAASTISGFGLYPVIRSRNLNLFALASLDSKRYIDETSASSVEKRINNTSLGLTGDLRDAAFGGGLNTFEVLWLSGTVRFDNRPASDPPDERFNKVLMRALRLQSLVPGVLQGLVSLRLQKAFDNLDVTEQFRAGGPDGVRAFPPGEGIGDNGVLATAELRAILPQPWYAFAGGQAVAALFYDHASIELRNERRDGAPRDERLQYAGWGLSLTWASPSGWELRASLATPTRGEARDEKDQSNARLYVQLGKQF